MSFGFAHSAIRHCQHRLGSAPTGSLVPFELYELSRALTVMRALALAVNVAAVVYLIYRVRHPVGERRAD